MSDSTQDVRIVRFARGGERPCLRALEALPIDTPEGRRIALRDPMGYADGSVILSPEAFAVAALMDGIRSVRDIQLELAHRYNGMLVYSDRIQLLAQILEEHGYLEGRMFETLRRRAAEEYRASGLRLARHAGAAYPGDPEELEARLRALYLDPEGPGEPPRPPAAGARVRAVISPHIDLHRGGPVYAWAYKSLFEGTDADLFVIFGTAHASPKELFSLTTKAYDTPLGPVEVDQQVVEGLRARLGDTLFADEIVHRGEHSIEFQAVLLRSLYRARPDVRIVPILCSSLHDVRDPSKDARVTDLLEALGVELEGRKVCFIAAADLAHVGVMFGDPRAPDADRLRELAEADQRSLSLALRGEADAFFHDVRDDGDARRICGLTPIYMTVRASGAKSGSLLRYAQWVGDNSSVTYAAAALGAEDS